jgi:hypothetical protein
MAKMSLVSPKRLIYVPHRTISRECSIPSYSTIDVQYRVTNFRQKNYSGENERRTRRLFRQNSACFAEQKHEWISSRVLASHRGGPGSIPDWGMSVLGPLDRDGLGQVS